MNLCKSPGRLPSTKSIFLYLFVRTALYYAMYVNVFVEAKREREDQRDVGPEEAGT